jgi:hypothetical protein
MGVYEKLLAVQSELKAPKDQYNSFGGYKYRSCESIMEAVKPILAKYKAVILLDDEMVEVAGRVYVKATAQFIDCEDAKGIETHAFAREDESKKGMDGSQLTGATSSYARKYALNGLLAIDDTKDADATQGKDEREKPAMPQEKQQKKPAAIICERCKEQVKPGKTKEGKLWSVTDMVTYSKLRFKGAVYCQDCMKAAFDAEQVAAEAAAQ